MIKRILGILGALGILGSIFLNFYLFRKTEKLQENNLVTEVIDGDSFILKTDQSIRLDNLDAPELKYCGGPEAKKRLEELVLGKIVEYEISAFDIFHRPIAQVYVDGKFVNEIMLKEGWAKYDSTSKSKREVLKKAYDYAFEEKIGIFSSLCRQEEPENPKCLIKGNIERNTNKKFYFFPGCSNYQNAIIEKDIGESWFCTEKEAREAGFVKASNCP